ncbi:YopX family protein [Clostridium cylindrosporum]|uniref:Phage protein TIGR01671 n=1 Tax=Clostridium cylindrosporum DSM 605 TaxID=1121307 RepID=A0A0J8DFG1_CLOCY|nr:YopX family protein [Clostridium cylindrosporum]KMT22989.1 phage protein TIGR01671 [Clostridium cylindrosporum DSM 605]
MPKDIKFRAWDKEEQEMIDHDDLQQKDGDCWCVYNIITHAVNEDDDLVFMQYTGRKDKNGKEIYEGDIVEGGFMNPLTNKFISKKYLIVYNSNGGYYKGELIGSTPYGDTWLQFIEGEVIGNIYEHPSLFKEVTE